MTSFDEQSPEIFKNKTGILEQVILCKASTTFLLEKLIGKKIHAHVFSQFTANHFGQLFYMRVSKLFIQPDNIPILYATSLLDFDSLTAEEKGNIYSGNLPIGRVIDPDNTGCLVKKNVNVLLVNAPHIAEILGIKSDILFRKKYRFYRNSVLIGSICEYFNHEPFIDGLPSNYSFDQITETIDGV